MSKKKRTNLQNRIIHQLLTKWNFTDDDKAEMVYDITGGRSASSAQMTFEEANVMIKRLKGDPVSYAPRTVAHHKQKAGVKTLASSTHKDFMNNLARGRKITEDGLERLSARVNQGVKKPRTTKEVNRVIEAIKKMNERDKNNPVATASTGQKEAA